MIKNKNLKASNKLQFLDNIYIEKHNGDGDFVKVGLKEDVVEQNGRCLTYYRIFEVNPRRD